MLGRDNLSEELLAEAPTRQARRVGGRTLLGLAAAVSVGCGMCVLLFREGPAPARGRERARLGAVGRGDGDELAAGLLARRGGNTAGGVEAFMGLPDWVPNPLEYVLSWKRTTRDEDESKYPGPGQVPAELRVTNGVASGFPGCQDAAAYPPDAADLQNATRRPWTDSAGLGCKTWKDANCAGGEFGVTPGVNYETACCACGGGVYDASPKWQDKLKDPFSLIKDTRLDTGLDQVGLGIDEKGERFQDVDTAKSRCLAAISCGGFSVSATNAEGEATVYFNRNLKYKTRSVGLGWNTYWKSTTDVAVRCDDDCTSDVMTARARFDHINNGVCEDGGPSAASFKCGYGTDCTDCGMRPYSPPDKQELAWAKGQSYNWSDVVCSDATVHKTVGCDDMLGPNGKIWTDAESASDAETANTCDYYAGSNRCKSEDADKKSYQDMSAKTACCGCGGGKRSSSQAPTIHSWMDSKLRRCDWYCEQGQSETRCAMDHKANGMNAASACCCCGGGTINLKAAYQIAPEEPAAVPWYLDWESLGVPGIAGMAAFCVCIICVTQMEKTKGK